MQTLAALFTFSLLWVLLPLANNIRKARSTGLRYVVVPCFLYNILTAKLFKVTVLRLVDQLLPAPTLSSWRILVTSLWPLKYGHAPFKELGTDSVLVVAPGGNILYTSDAHVVSQIMSRGNDFPKPVAIYKQIDIYGKNVISSEGNAWRYHRRLTRPAFSEKNNQLVWKETIDLSGAMVSKLQGLRSGSTTVKNAGDDMMRLSLEVLGRAGLGDKSAGFTSSLEYVSVHIVSIMALMMFPKWIIQRIPAMVVRRLLKAYEDWKSQMQAMIRNRRSAILTGAYESVNTDLISQLVKGHSPNTGPQLAQPLALSDSEVLGNLFVFMVAGHETTANTIHFTLLQLALNPKIQQNVQKALEDIFQGRPPATWSYEHDFPRLMDGFLGAAVRESLRVISPSLTLPKTTHRPQQLNIDGKEVTLPANTLIRVCVPGVHRNPRYWPYGPRKDSKGPDSPLNDAANDLDEFKPERWMAGKGSPGKSDDGSDSQSSGNSSSRTTTKSETRQKPPKGAYIPFSDGQRSCLGKRFAQVEMMAALAVILSECTVELAVDEWATDEEVVCMTTEERKSVWQKASEKAEMHLREKMTCIITVQLAKGYYIPLRFVEKGCERFREV
ncbi:hypothetical protein HYALB_00010963 [Hymenoscyphus albidus]|uniref:Cytochrome P450 n=1 Tax=Hymenoscyphus albidus TaxID=595503 RepID=A0A9N9Q8M0_9HELO|nr:hypothetical protein HYALB_00010963 [Hymenoscyphus albidus]